MLRNFAFKECNFNTLGNLDEMSNFHERKFSNYTKNRLK